MENKYVNKLINEVEMSGSSLDACHKHAWDSCLKSGEHGLALAVTEKYLKLKFGYERRSGKVSVCLEATPKKGFFSFLRRTK